MKNFNAMVHLDAQGREERDHAKGLSKKTLMYTDKKATSLYLSPPTALQSSYGTRPLTHDIARSKLAFSHKRYCQFYRLAARMFTAQQCLTSRIYRRLQRLKLVLETPPLV